MNFDFSDDQKLLKDQARKFLTDKCSRQVVRSVLDNSENQYSKKLWQEIVNMGWTATAIPEEYGGLGLGMLELCVIAEELGRSLAPIPFSSSIYIFAEFLKAYGSEEQKQQYLPKIASGELTNLDLIDYISKMKIPMMISTGMTSISEISKVVEIVQSNNCPFSLLHCISSYPAKHSDANLSTIPQLQKTFDIPVGFSDHSLGIDISLAAVALGATIIEKHFTLDKNMPGPDQKLSIDPNELSNLVKKIRIIEKAMGSSRKTVFKTEESFRKNMRKSLGAAQNIPVNTIIKRSMITSFRPGTGIPPYLIDEFIGRKTKKTIKKGSLLNWDFF